MDTNTASVVGPIPTIIASTAGTTKSAGASTEFMCTVDAKEEVPVVGRSHWTGECPSRPLEYPEWTANRMDTRQSASTPTILRV